MSKSIVITFSKFLIAYGSWIDLEEQEVPHWHGQSVLPRTSIFSIRHGPRPTEGPVILDWPIPTNSTTLLSVLGTCIVLSAIYTAVCGHCSPASCTNKERCRMCQCLQCTHKSCLLRAPVLAYPQFCHNAGKFVSQTDVSAVGLGTVLEPGGTGAWAPLSFF